MPILNYTAKILIIIAGIIFLSGVIVPPNGDTILYRIMGVVFILFGIYRIVMYRRKLKQYEGNEDAKGINKNS